MSILNRKNISVALLITLGATFSVNANAADTSIENSISELVIEQSQQVMSDLTVQLKQSITEELNSFSIDYSIDEAFTDSLAWLTDGQQASAMTDEVKQAESNTTTKSKLL